VNKKYLRQHYERYTQAHTQVFSLLFDLTENTKITALKQGDLDARLAALQRVIIELRSGLSLPDKHAER
jgi:hypothetical protein